MHCLQHHISNALLQHHISNALLTTVINSVLHHQLGTANANNQNPEHNQLPLD